MTLGFWRRTYFSFIVAFLVVCQSCAPAAVESRGPTDRASSGVRLRVDGRYIVDSGGKPAVLRGIYSRSEWLDSEQEVQLFKEWGVNFLRILLTFDEHYWDVVNNGIVDVNKRCVLREENLQHMDERLRWLEDSNIYYVIQVHWRELGIDDNLIEPDLLAKQLAGVYAKLARRYRDKDHLLGFATLSEIYVKPELYSAYRDIVTAIVDAVHEVSPDLIISSTGVQTSSVESLIDAVHIDRPNVIYDFHFYAPSMFTHYRTTHGDLRYPGWIADGWASGVEFVDIEYLREKLRPGLEFSTKWNVPIWCGEFGAFNNAPDNSSLRWEQDVVQLFEEHHIPWIFWTWRPGNTDVPEYWKQLWQHGASEPRTTIAPHGGPFSTSLTVSIYNNLNDAHIRYTLDGTEPETDSEPYTGPFTINEAVVIKARSFSDGEPQTPTDAASFYELPIRLADNPTGLAPGLQYSYYEIDANQIDELDGIERKKGGMAKTLDRAVAARDNGIALTFTGFLEVPRDGLYYFYSADAGISTLLIGDELVVDNPLSRWINRRTGFIALKAGKHAITVTYRRADKTEVFYSGSRKDEWFKIEYEGPGIKKQPIPAAALFHLSGQDEQTK